MALYKIADIITEYRARGSMLRGRSEKYGIGDDVQPEISFDITDEEIISYRRKTPLLNDTEREYMIAGAKFYKELISFGGMMLHSSAVVLDGEAYLFSAPSGTGKSTHTSLWLQHFGDRAFILNDDKPAIRVTDNGIFVYGTPFSGKNDISENTGVPLKAVAVLSRGDVNTAKKLSEPQAIYSLLNQSVRPQEPVLMDCLMKTVERIITDIPVIAFSCNISEEAVITAYNAMRG
ncbi:MAG: hypothetical protein IJB86_09765 [Clostridia bacterium]|nr:hypothetical protein [Clostridia bacterium]